MGTSRIGLGFADHADTSRTRADEKKEDACRGGLLHATTTGEIIRAFFSVYDDLGYGFVESVYSNALARRFTELGLPFRREHRLAVYYHGEPIGSFKADFLVADAVIVEVKASLEIDDANRKQLSNYLRCGDKEVGLLLHFGPKARFERIVFSNHRKPSRLTQGMDANRVRP